MTDEADAPPYSVLERIDLALASRVSARAQRMDVERAAELGVDLVGLPRGGDAEWIRGALELRGIRVELRDVSDVLHGRSTRFRPDHQEHSLIIGLEGILGLLRERGTRGVQPDGWCMVDLFRVLVRDIARFRNCDVRRDQPWDAVFFVKYPEPEEIRGLLDTFHPDYRFRDMPLLFDRLHPVRQAFRILWRFARLAPFPDFNLVMAFVAMNASLLARGYPLVCAEPGDREVLARIVSGPVPHKITQFETRLLARVEG